MAFPLLSLIVMQLPVDETFDLEKNMAEKLKIQQERLKLSSAKISLEKIALSGTKNNIGYFLHTELGSSNLCFVTPTNVFIQIVTLSDLVEDKEDLRAEVIKFANSLE